MDRRQLLFFTCCLTSRLLLAVASYYVPDAWLPLCGYLALGPAIGFMTLYTLGLRETGKGMNGGDIWWVHMRPIHGVMYLLFALFAIRGERYGSAVLVSDALVGAAAAITHMVTR